MTETNQSKGRMRSLLANLTERITGLNDMIADIKKLDSYATEIQSMISTFVGTAHEGIVLVQEGKFVWVNKAACDISGYKENEILNLNLEQSTVPEDRDKLYARVKMTLAGDIADLPVEWRMLRKDRTIKYVNAFAYRVKFIEKLAIMVFFYDMTESKEIHDELSMRAQILDVVGDEVFLLDISGKIIYANEALCEQTGYSREELLTMNIRDLVPPDRMNRFEIRIKQYSEHKEARHNAIAISKKGVRVAVELRGKIIKRGGKQFILIVSREIKQAAEPDMEP
jgi:PAS domain S-box-containing protein